MGLNRFKIHEADFAKAKQYLQKKLFKKDTPNWVVKNATNLSVDGGKVLFNGLPIIPVEKQDEYLRKQIFGKKSKVPLSRDGMYHQVFKGKNAVAGISRRKIMEFLRAQSVVQKGKGAEPVPKLAGKKVKDYAIEFDLIFLKARDVAKANKHFRDNPTLQGSDDTQKGLTYLLSVVESVTGLTKIMHLSRKLPKIVSPAVVQLMKQIASDLRTPLSKINVYSDKGQEFSQKLIEPHVKSYKRVATGPSVEKKNSDIQRTFFQMVRARRGKTVKSLVDLTESIVNNNINRITGQTASESVEKQDKKKTIAQYNKKRAVGTDGKKLVVGDYVRLRLKTLQKDKGLDYKTYKNILWSKKVYRVGGVTQKLPRKYRVNRRWYLSGMLLKTRPTDETSEAIIKKRDEVAEAEKEKKVEQDIRESKARLAADIAKAKKKAPKSRKRKKPRSKRLAKFLAETAAAAKDEAPMPTMRRGRRRARERMIQAQETDREQEKLIGH